MSKEVGGMVRSRTETGAGSARTEDDRSPCRRRGGWGGDLGAGAAVEREPQTGCRAAAPARRVARRGVA